jgi:hypothetical protein
MLPVSAVLVCGVFTITCISCIQRDNFSFKFKHCILSGINITASKDLKQQEYYLVKCMLQNVSAHCSSLVGILAWIFHIRDFC